MSRRILPFIVAIIIVAIAAFIGGIYADHLPAVIRLLNSPTPTPTDTPTLTPTLTPTDTATATPTNTPTDTATATLTATPTSTATKTPTATLTPTLTPTVSDTPTITPSPTSAAGQWTLDAKRSPIDDSPNVTLSLNAESSVGTRQPPILILRCTKADFYSMFISTGNILADSNTSARVRYDQDDPVTVDTGLSSDRTALFFSDANPIVDELLVHNQFAVEYSPFEQVPTTAVFDVRGFRAASDGFWNACNNTTSTPVPTPIRLPTLTPSITPQAATLTPVAP